GNSRLRLWPPVKTKSGREENRHLPASDRRIRTVVAISAATGDAGRDKGFNESVERMSNGHVGERRRRRIGTDLQLVADARRCNRLHASCYRHVKLDPVRK